MNSFIKLSIYLIILIIHGCHKPVGVKTKDCVNKLTSDDKKLFSNIGFFYYKKIMKWDHDISIAIKGDDIRPEDPETVRAIVAELTPLITPLKITLIKNVEKADITIDFTYEITKLDIYGYTKPEFRLFSSAFKKADVFIFPIQKGDYRWRTVQHEMMHAIGFNHNKTYLKDAKFYDTTMNAYVLKSYDKADEDKFMKEHRKYSETDKRMIKLLYSNCIPLGLSKKDFDELIDSN
ncbi:hypothetical protein A5893_09130 [Pedobacter psychrophilus]|uniref:Peptidase metallopeptidase domain-containing protein n=1 Tax=Pedobacter psychrophilus TaxID=1826909 RepID=A0A179DFA4_9SPHI|nr:hypothetical protein [Pedobacter psychrophilus]OAQ39735.1 hypothetical protein A5893_09130 [Pedobacter psychrophilus]